MQELTKDTFKDFTSGTKVLVDFWATWCGPCMRQGQLLAAMTEDDEALSAKIGKVNVDDERAIAVEYGIMSIPTLIVFSEGKEVKRLIGLQDEETIRDILSE